MAVSKRLRYEILRRDDHACRYCGAKAPDVPLTVDHVVPTALGGSDEPSNLVAACGACNSGKTSSSPDAPLVATVNDDAIRWARAMQAAAAISTARVLERNAYVQSFDEAWNEWTVAGEPAERDGGWRTTIGRFHDIGLPLSLLLDTLDDVMPRKVPTYRIWRYFCGAAWNVVRQQQEMAAALIERESTL